MERIAPLFAGVVILAVFLMGAAGALAVQSPTAGSGTQITTTSTSGAPGGFVILPAGTVLQVSSSYDCVAGHYSVPFSIETPSMLSGRFSAGRPGVTLYVATAQQASDVFQGHPSAWTYSTGLQNSTHFTAALGAGSYVAWIEGANMNCGATIAMPLEELTTVNVTQAFTIKSTLMVTTTAGSS